MIELDNIKLQTTWNDAARDINSNFAKILIELAKGGQDESMPSEYLSDAEAVNHILTITKSDGTSVVFTDTTYDLTPYAKTDDVTEALANKADKTDILFELTEDGRGVRPKEGRGILTPSFISSQGSNPSAGTIVGSFDKDQMWGLLGAETAEQINISHLTAALTGYAKTEDLTQYLTADALNGYAKTVDVTSAVASSLATAKGYTDTKIGDLIGGAPTTLDTLKEIADAITAGGTAMDALVNQVGGKVDKVDGKGLVDSYHAEFLGLMVSAIDQNLGFPLSFVVDQTYDGDLMSVGYNSSTRQLSIEIPQLWIMAEDSESDTVLNSLEVTLPLATTSLAGLMAASDKVALNDTVRKSVTTEQVMSGALRLTNLTATGFVSAQGSNAAAGGIGGGSVFDKEQMWHYLQDSGTELIAVNHIPDLSGKYLPLSGGTVNGTANYPLVINTTHASEIQLRLTMSNAARAAVGYNNGIAYVSNDKASNSPRLGINDSGVPQYWVNWRGTTKYDLIHSGNIASQSVERLRLLPEDWAPSGYPVGVFGAKGSGSYSQDDMLAIGVRNSGYEFVWMIMSSAYGGENEWYLMKGSADDDTWDNRFKIYHSGNLTPSGYLKEDGSVGMSNHLNFYYNGIAKVQVGWQNDEYGTFLYSFPGGAALSISDSGEPRYVKSKVPYTLLHSGNYSSYAPTINTNTPSTLSTNILGYANTLKDPAWKTTGPSIQFGSGTSYGKLLQGSYNSNNLYLNTNNNGTLMGWVEIITSGNIGSQSVAESKALAQLYTFNSRPTSANINFHDGKVRYFLATSSMTTAKPSIGDSGILDLAWDKTSFDMQMAFGNTGRLAYRTQKADLSWNAWRELAFIDSNVASASALLDAGSTAQKVTVSYYKAGLNYDDFTWLAGWNGDELRTVHKDFFMKKKEAYVSCSAVGWYRIVDTTNLSGKTIRLNIWRIYNNTNNECYTFDIAIAYNGGISIVQTSGIANTRIIDKIRVDYSASRSHIDIHYSSSSRNEIYWSIEGEGEVANGALNPTLIGSTQEFSLENGCRSLHGFVGALWSKNITPTTSHAYNIGSPAGVYERIYGRYFDTDSGYDMRLCTGGTERMQIVAATGHVLINTTSDSTHTVEVAGDMGIHSIYITKKDDNYGLFPVETNWNQIGASNRRWFRAYINKIYTVDIEATGNIITTGAISAQSSNAAAATI